MSHLHSLIARNQPTLRARSTILLQVLLLVWVFLGGGAVREAFAGDREFRLNLIPDDRGSGSCDLRVENVTKGTVDIFVARVDGGGGEYGTPQTKTGDTLRVTGLVYGLWKITVRCNQPFAKVSRFVRFSESSTSASWKVDPDFFSRDELLPPPCDPAPGPGSVPGGAAAGGAIVVDRETVTAAVRYGLSYIDPGQADAEIWVQVDHLVAVVLGPQSAGGIGRELVSAYQQRDSGACCGSILIRHVRGCASTCGCADCSKWLRRTDGFTTYVFRLDTGEPVPDMDVSYEEWVVKDGGHTQIGGQAHVVTDRFGSAFIRTFDKFGRPTVVTKVFPLGTTAKGQSLGVRGVEYMDKSGFSGLALFALAPPEMGSDPIVETDAVLFVQRLQEAGNTTAARRIGGFFGIPPAR